MERITSRKNELAAYIRKLSGSRSARRAAGEFVCDGPKLLAEALKWGAAVTTGHAGPPGPRPRMCNRIGTNSLFTEP